MELSQGYNQEVKISASNRRKIHPNGSFSMTESIPSPTRLANLLEQESSQQTTALRLISYRGVGTSQQFDAPGTETDVLLSGAAVHDLGWMRRIALRGEDRLRWLNGMVTNNVLDLAVNSGAWNFVLNAQGRILGDLHVWRAAGTDETDSSPVHDLELQIEADQAPKLLAHFDHFIIMDDVTLVPLDTDEDVNQAAYPLGLGGPLADRILEKMGIAPLPGLMTQARSSWNGHSLLVRREFGVLIPHYSLWITVAALSALWHALQSAGAIPVGCTAVEAVRVAEGIPVYGVDIVESCLAQETSQMRALHFSKGCYLGQEIVERIHSRGSVHRHLRQLELTGPLPTTGAELTLNAAPVGQLTSVAQVGVRTMALGMVRADTEIGAQTLDYPNGTAQLLTSVGTLNSFHPNTSAS